MSLQDASFDCGDRFGRPGPGGTSDGGGSLDEVLSGRDRSAIGALPLAKPPARGGARAAFVQDTFDHLIAGDLGRRGRSARRVTPTLRHGPFSYAATTMRLFKGSAVPDTSSLGRYLSLLSSGEEAAASSTDAEACSELTRRLVLLLATLSEVLTVMGSTSCAIDGRAGFSKPFDDLLRDRVTVSPRRFRDFSDALYLDLRSSVLEQGRIDFAWGDLQIVGRSLTLSVARREPVGPKLGGRVTVLE